jgi:hypothetical protein
VQDATKHASEPPPSRATIAFGEEFLYELKASLRAAACGGRPRPAASSSPPDGLACRPSDVAILEPRACAYGWAVVAASRLL